MVGARIDIETAQRRLKVSVICPDWLDTVGKTYWKKHHRLVKVKPECEESFAVLCQVYSDLGNPSLEKNRKHNTDLYIRLARYFSLLPDPSKKQVQESAHYQGMSPEYKAWFKQEEDFLLR